jgi:hypothetical protein
MAAAETEALVAVEKLVATEGGGRQQWQRWGQVMQQSINSNSGEQRLWRRQ